MSEKDTKKEQQCSEDKVEGNHFILGRKFPPPQRSQSFLDRMLIMKTSKLTFMHVKKILPSSHMQSNASLVVTNRMRGS